MTTYTVPLAELNSLLTCRICQGYMIKPVLNTECEHSFCKTCFVKHLLNNNSCPICNVVLHTTEPLKYVNSDPQMEQILNSLFPDIQKREIENEQQYFARQALPATDLPYDGDQITVHFCAVSKPQADQLGNLFLRCSNQVTIAALKRFISFKLLETRGHYNEIDVFSDGRKLGDEFSLRFVQVSFVKNRMDDRILLKYHYNEKPSPPCA